MRRADNFLIAIVVGVVLLAGAAFAVAILQPAPEYRPDDSPEGVAHNYLLALQQDNYERGYGYLDPSISGYPETLEQYEQDVREYGSNFRANDSVSLEVLRAEVRATGATVEVGETVFYSSGPFDSGEFTNTFEMELARGGAGGSWKIRESQQYWAWCWNQEGGCP